MDWNADVSAAALVLAAQLAGLVLLGLFLFRRGARRTAPVFSGYAIYSAAAIFLQCLASANPPIYFKVFWFTHAAGSLLAIASLYEAFVKSFKGFFVLNWFRWLLPAVALCVAGYATWKALARPPLEGGSLLKVIVGLEIGLQYLIVATFLCYAILHKRLKISYSRFRYGVAAGFAISSFGMLAATLVRSEFGTRFFVFATWAPPVAYLLALFVWIASSLTPLADESEIPGANEITAADALNQLHQYRSTLEKVRK